MSRNITDVGVFEGNTPAIWGYHQSLIVRTGDRVFAAITEPRGEGFQQQWSLFERTAEGEWLRRCTSPSEEQINQPPTLLPMTKTGGCTWWPGPRARCTTTSSIRAAAHSSPR